MTTIAYRDGVLATDSQVTSGTVAEATATKAAKRGPVLAAASGDATICRRAMDWFRTGMNGDCPIPVPTTPDAPRSTLVLFPGGNQIIRFNHDGPSEMRAPFYADGSGWEIALGAMAAGATAEEAVHIASRYDTKTGGSVTTLRNGRNDA